MASIHRDHEHQKHKRQIKSRVSVSNSSLNQSFGPTGVGVDKSNETIMASETLKTEEDAPSASHPKAKDFPSFQVNVTI